MPLWSKDELEVVAKNYPFAINKWLNRFDILGGIPRLLFEDIERDPKSILLSDCKQCSVYECITKASIHSETLIHLNSEEPFRDATLRYASHNALQTIAQTKWIDERTKMENLLGLVPGILLLLHSVDTYLSPLPWIY